ncbi:MAG: non-ribosomal peptide synthetase, partial [Candidatus Aminicenantes bacterium]
MDLAQRLSKLSPQQRKLFELKLQQQNIHILNLPITKENRTNDHEQQRFPLSFGQERLWFIHQLEPKNTAYNIIKATTLEGSLDKHALEQSINEIIRRHEILRTVFITDKQEPAQVILNQLSLPLEIIDLKNFPKEKQKNEVKKIIQYESQYVFDLATAPLLKTKLVVLNEKEDQHVFLLLIHHIISDGWSIEFFIKEFIQLYQAFCQGKKSPLPELPSQYVDYACWQRRWFGEGAVNTAFRKKQEAYWLNQFSGEIPVLTLPTDYPRPMKQSFEGLTLFFDLDIHEKNTLKEMALTYKTTLYVLLLAIFNIFLSKLSGMEDIVIGTPVAGRRHPGLQGKIGMFVNTLALRNYPHHDKTFRDFLEEVRNQTLNAFENQEYRYEDLLGKLPLNRHTGRNPLFDVMFLFDIIDKDEIDIPGLTLKPYNCEKKTANFDLTLYVQEQRDILHFGFEYCTKLFNKRTIERFIGYFRQIVTSVISNPNQKISRIKIISKEEKKQVLFDFNNT